MSSNLRRNLQSSTGVVVAMSVGTSCDVAVLRALMGLPVDFGFHSEMTDHFRRAIECVMIERQLLIRFASSTANILS
ncbi:hypothetical protein [Pseudomonas umsongensis]|uniref:hypothetical protein n=1 Tax=Pseudomonas umsongensis TaxID=198618 RepID=UPI0015BC8BD9|nr:hypothetical protein [Pseudomonas umsongensis]